MPGQEDQLESTEEDASQLPGGRTVRSLEYTERYEGVLPHPRILKGFEDILPGATDRILKQAEQQAAHRQHLERTVIEGDARRSDAGLIVGAILTLATIAGAFSLAAIGQLTAGLSLGGLFAAPFIAVSVYVARLRNQERIRKSIMMDPNGEAPPAAPE